MFPSVNALNQNLAVAQRVRGDRLARSFDVHGPRDTAVGGPMTSPAWDAFFGALQDKAGQADDAGMNFSVNYGGVGRRPSPALQGLQRAVGR